MYRIIRVWYRLIMKTNTDIEPGLLPLFRLTIVMWLAIQIIRILFQMATATTESPLYINPAISLSLPVSLFMLFYLNSSRVQERMGQWYLPTGLMITTVSPMIIQRLSIGLQMEAGLVAQTSFAMRSMEVVFFPLFFSMIFIAAQYGFKVVIIYILGTAVLEMISFGALISIYGQAVFYKTIVFDIPFEAIAKRSVLQGITGFLIARVIHGQKRDRKVLGEKNLQLTQHAATVEQLAVSHERSRMARELHDTLAHTLSAVSVQLQALSTQFDSDPEGARQTLNNTSGLTRNGLKEVRRALQALRASPLEDLGLSMALRDLLKVSAERAGIDVEFSSAENIEGLSHEIEQSLYRICEEAVNNAIQHSDAKAINVTLSKDKGVLQLSITDDGTGYNISTNPDKGHFGIRGMHERADLCNGQLDIQSESGRGTIVIFTIKV